MPLKLVGSDCCTWRRLLSCEFHGSLAAEPPDELSGKSDAVGWLGGEFHALDVDQSSSHWFHLRNFLFQVPGALAHCFVLSFGALVCTVHSVAGCLDPQAEQ